MLIVSRVFPFISYDPMKPYLLVSSATLLSVLLTACGEKTPSPTNDSNDASAAAATSVPGDAADEATGEDTPDADMQRDLDAIAAEPIRLLAEGGAPKASIAANGDFTIGGKPVAVDDAQRARLVAYRAQLVMLTQAGAELGSRSTGALADKIGDAIGKVFEGDAPDDIRDELKAEARKLDAAARRLCDSLSPLLREQDALTAALPEFKPYAHFAQADAEACRGTVVSVPATGEKIGKTIGAGIGNPFKGGLVAGYLAAGADHAKRVADGAQTGSAEPSTASPVK
jgi:hypothetical protein